LIVECISTEEIGREADICVCVPQTSTSEHQSTRGDAPRFGSQSFLMQVALLSRDKRRLLSDVTLSCRLHAESLPQSLQVAEWCLEFSKIKTR